MLWKNNNYYIFWVRVFSISYPECKAHAPYYIVMCDLSGCTMFLHFISTKKWISGKSSLLLLQSALRPLGEFRPAQQEGFTDSRCQRHVKPSTWKRTRDLERSNFRHKRLPASEATLANPAGEGGTMGEKWPREFCGKWRLPRHFWVLLRAVKHDMGQTVLLPLRRKACWGFFSPEKSDGFGRVWTRELG
jgi:hypothetical protein